MSTTSSKPPINILGHADIPASKSSALVPSEKLREILTTLEPGRATVIETLSHAHARYLVSMLHSMRQIMTGKRGTIKTKCIEQMVYVWPVEPSDLPTATYLFES